MLRDNSRLKNQLRSWLWSGTISACGLSVGIFSQGCSRFSYSRAADRESYCLIDSRQVNPLWQLPSQPVEPAPQSRMRVPGSLDCAPQPDDDDAARRWMNCPDGFDNTAYYSQIPVNGEFENPVWLEYLSREEDGNIRLTQPLAMDLALLHSRDYQTQFEQVYLSALDLSGNRFEFDSQWFGGLGTSFLATGSDGGDQRNLNVTTDRLGFTRNLAGGGQFATSILNSLFWDFGNSGIQGGSAALVTTFTQPLLRGAFRYVRLENLTQAERNLLYAVRGFARFRRLFYVDVTSSYLDLLTQVQAIRNTQANVLSLEQNLEEHKMLVNLQMVSQVQADQVFQQYQNGRLSLLAAQQSLISSMDQFKFSLGLPPWVPFEMDESLLDPFEFVAPELEELQTDAQLLFEDLVQYLPPEVAPRAVLLEGWSRMVDLHESLAQQMTGIEEEFDVWSQRIESTNLESLREDDRLDLEQQQTLAISIQERLRALKESLNNRHDLHQRVKAAIDEYDLSIKPQPISSRSGNAPNGLFDRLHYVAQETPSPATNAWDLLQTAVGQELREQIAEMYVAQTQIRLFLIDIAPHPLQSETAVTYAHHNRLDLMNSQASVMDAFRKVEVAANALESELNINGGITVGSDPSQNNAFRFDSSANQYRLGVQFDGPLNRLNERNNYRAAQIVYQRTSRNYVADKDRVANEVRAILRRLELSRLNFQIARQQLVAASRQVDQAQFDMRRTSEANSNLTLFLLQALQSLLNAKNNLIQNWITYRVEKMRLFAALEMLYLDENGVWMNEDTGIEDIGNLNFVDEQYYREGAMPGVLPAQMSEPDSQSTVVEETSETHFRLISD
ncbi:MAG: TolC family protein [Planctomycetales bacterium]|nr:TolC family protein [Planctomycetales bacterium]